VREGALAEVYFQLTRQPVFPSKPRYCVHRIKVNTRSTLQLRDLDELGPFAIDKAYLSGADYSRTQAIGDVANFLGFDSLLVPCVRWPCENLVIFTEQLAPEDLSVEETEFVDWDAWKSIRERR
jgi:hypothetical protein